MQSTFDWPLNQSNLIKYNCLIGFRLLLIESIKQSWYQSNFPKFFVIDSMSVRLPYDYYYSIAFDLWQFSKTPLFSARFSRELRMNKTKEIDKRSKEFLFRHIFKVFANSVSPHSKIWCLRFSNEQNGIIFFIPPVGDLPKIEKCLYLTTAMECNSFKI